MVLVMALLAVVAALAGAVVAVALSRRQWADAASERSESISTAVAAALAEARGVLAEERTATVQATVQSATSIASSTLADTVQASRAEQDQRDRHFSSQVGAIAEQLHHLGSLVHELQRERAEQTGSLRSQLQSVAATQQALAQHTDALRTALASPKARGQWGERMADDVLAAAGMKEGVQYLRQKAIPGGSIPDVRFLLPQGLEVRMDVKFPVDNYLRALDAADDTERSRHTKAFVRDVRSRITELPARGYIDARDTVDCLLLFIPNEAVFGFIHEHDPQLVDVALANKVVLCSPSTLFGVLAVIRHSVEQFQLERTSDEILRALSGLTEEWTKFTGSLDKVARQIDTVQRSFHDEVNGTRRRVFEKELDRIESLRRQPLVDHADPAHTLDQSGGGDHLAARKAAGDVRTLPLSS